MLVCESVQSTDCKPRPPDGEFHGLRRGRGGGPAVDKRKNPHPKDPILIPVSLGDCATKTKTLCLLRIVCHATPKKTKLIHRSSGRDADERIEK